MVIVTSYISLEELLSSAYDEEDGGPDLIFNSSAPGVQHDSDKSKTVLFFGKFTC